jgi:hypothetical protein
MCFKLASLCLLLVPFVNGCRVRVFNSNSESTSIDGALPVGIRSLQLAASEKASDTQNVSLSVIPQNAIMSSNYLAPGEVAIVPAPFGINIAPNSSIKPVQIVAAFDSIPTQIWEIDTTSREVRAVPFIRNSDGISVQFGVVPVSTHLYLPIYSVENPRSLGNPERLFSVIENSGGRIVIRLGRMHHQYEMYLVSLYQGGKKIVDSLRVNLAEGGFATFQVPENGYYRIDVTTPHISYEKNQTFVLWRQDVFAQHSSRSLVSAEDRESLAKKFAPVVMYHDDEKYFPKTLSYLLNKEEPDALLNEERYNLVTPFGTHDIPFREIESTLPYVGDNRALLKPKNFNASRMKTRGEGKNSSAVYFSLIEDRSASLLYLNYHFFYCFDPKTGNADHPGFGSHIFDRESMTVVLDAKTRQPVDVVYNQHQENQEVGILDEQMHVAQRWKKGRIRVPWNSAFKVGDHPIAAPARGSHAIYQSVGTYKILALGKIPLDFLPANEPAGGFKNVIRPENLVSRRGFPAYKLIDLSFYELTSSSPNRILAFSGFLVDVPGTVNAHFSPFLEREMLATAWVTEAATWAPDSLPKSTLEQMRLFVQGF